MSASLAALNEQDAMRRAMALAERGWGRVHPNPLVGAVVLRDGRVIGEGWHAEYGGLHAERMALQAAGTNARGATLVVTLEPCGHYGKQPPCVDAIIASGIVRVVIGMTDPNPEATGGIARFKSGGMKVTTGVLEDEVRRQNVRFTRRFEGHRRPYVAVKLAVTMDGMIADRHGQSKWISGDEARAWVQHLRAGYAAIGVGAETAITDDVRLTVRGPVEPRIAPTRVIFDRTGRLPRDHGILADAGDVPVVIVRDPSATSAAPEGDGVSVLSAADLDSALEQLAGLGLDAILVEGGGRLAGALLRDGLVDRIYQVQSPAWLGRGRPAWSELGERRIGDAIRWRIVDRMPLGDDTLLVLEP